MSSMKSGFSTLNRWLGKKNKDKTATNGSLSKSNTNLSISNTNINETSQLEYNRITPLPAATSNAPFEQTFRITVLLPKEQLYVARLGARVPLSKLLQLVCDNKLLDPDKYEFRNPVDASQPYSCDLSIGAVGLSEIRLCHKSDPYSNGNYNNEALQRSAVIRDSLSSSEFSSRYSKHTTKTTSPYSSSNSLNSMDSTGMNYTRKPVSPPPVLFPKTAATTGNGKIEAPPRKKRAAPRPPSQTAIPEKSALVIEPQTAPSSNNNNNNSSSNHNANAETVINASIMRKNHYLSTPNLNSTLSLASNGIDCNGNDSNKLVEEMPTVQQKNARNLYGGSVQNLSSAEPSQKLPEPTPRKRLIPIKKKAAPSVPPGTRASMCFDDDNAAAADDADDDVDAASIASTPTAATALIEQQSPQPEIVKELPKPLPRATTMTLLNASNGNAQQQQSSSNNVSKVMLNRTPTPEPQSFDSDYTSAELLNNSAVVCEDDDNVSKQADSGIGEPVPSPIPDSLPSEGSTHESKSTFESSSDDDDMIKVYNFKLGKTHIKPMETLEDLTVIAADSDSVSAITPGNLTHEHTPSGISETTSWNFSMPISPPPNFADNGKQLQHHAELESISDAPITPKLKERPVLNFENLNVETPKVTTAAASAPSQSMAAEQSNSRALTPISPTTPLNELVDELSSIMQEQRIDTLIKKAPNAEPQIEAAKPNTLSNFSISTITSQQLAPAKLESKQIKTAMPDTTSNLPAEEEKLYRKRGSITNGNLYKRNSVSRADSFHSTAQTQSQYTTTAASSAAAEQLNGLNSRSASFLSLTKLEQNAGLLRRRSSSELSIGESPSLQSLEVIKTILNSRKNSLANSSNSSGDEELKAVAANTVEQPKVNPTTLTAEPVKTVNNQVPKTYRYSGPPSINFSTWSERPKAQVVAIKNEGDYIIGVGKQTNQSQPLKEKSIETTAVPAQLSPIERMGISMEQQNFKMPISVKPLKDVIIDGSTTPTTPTTNTIPKASVNVNSTTISFVGKTKWNHNKDVKTELSVAPRPVSQITHTSTLPRSNANRLSLTSATSTPTATATSKAPTATAALLRSTSINKLEATNNAVPFGQNTLRKTGLKEKILAKEQAAQQKAVATSNNQNTVTVNAPAKTLQSAKLELKLQSTAVYLNSNPNTMPKSAPILPPPAPAAPPMPALKSVPAKSKSANSTPTDDADSRDQLLAAIRSFNRQQLNRT